MRKKNDRFFLFRFCLNDSFDKCAPISPSHFGQSDFFPLDKVHDASTTTLKGQPPALTIFLVSICGNED